MEPCFKPYEDDSAPAQTAEVAESAAEAATAVVSRIGAIGIGNYFKRLGFKGVSGKFTYLYADLNRSYSINSGSFW